jgi:hypothetical protein
VTNLEADLSIAQLVVTVILSVITILQAFATFRLNKRLQAMNVSLDQRVQRLQRLRDLTLQIVYRVKYMHEARHLLFQGDTTEERLELYKFTGETIRDMTEADGLINAIDLEIYTLFGVSIPRQCSSIRKLPSSASANFDKAASRVFQAIYRLLPDPEGKTRFTMRTEEDLSS